MTKRDRETAVENVLKRWRKLQEEIKAVEDDAANMAFSQGSGDPVQSSSISDKTARGAALLESVAEKKAWISCVEAAHFKRLGVKAGVPDLLLPYPVGDHHGLWIELKSLSGKPSPAQREWILWLREQGYCAYICRGADAAIRCIEAYIGNDFSAVGTAKPITRTRCI